MSGTVVGLVQAFVGSEGVITARVFVGHESAMSALGTGLVGSVKTTMVNEFSTAGHHVTSQDGTNVQIGLAYETLVLESGHFRLQAQQP